jgi:hypothetical protein
MKYLLLFLLCKSLGSPNHWVYRSQCLRFVLWTALSATPKTTKKLTRRLQCTASLKLWFIVVKRNKAKSAKVQCVWNGSQNQVGTGVWEPFLWGISQGMIFLSCIELPCTREAHYTFRVPGFHWELVKRGLGLTCSKITHSHVKAGGAWHKPYCSYKQCKYSEPRYFYITIHSQTYQERTNYANNLSSCTRA